MMIGVPDNEQKTSPFNSLARVRALQLSQMELPKRRGSKSTSKVSTARIQFLTIWGMNSVPLSERMDGLGRIEVLTTLEGFFIEDERENVRENVTGTDLEKLDTLYADMVVAYENRYLMPFRSQYLCSASRYSTPRQDSAKWQDQRTARRITSGVDLWCLKGVRCLWTPKTDGVFKQQSVAD